MKKIVACLCLLIAQASLADTCFIIEYTEMGETGTGKTVPVAGREVNRQAVVFDASTQSDPFTDTTEYVRIVCDAKAHFALGDNPTATETDAYFPQDTPEYISVKSGDEVAFYDGST